MSNNIIIRKAKQDWVCDCCGHIIKSGTEYLDKVILNNGKCVQHTRYHDECPVHSKLEELLLQFARSGESIPCSHGNEKYRVFGFSKDLATDELYVHISTWDRVDIDIVKGNVFLDTYTF